MDSLSSTSVSIGSGGAILALPHGPAAEHAFVAAASMEARRARVAALRQRAALIKDSNGNASRRHSVAGTSSGTATQVSGEGAIRGTPLYPGVRSRDLPSPKCGEREIEADVEVEGEYALLARVVQQVLAEAQASSGSTGGDAVQELEAGHGTGTTALRHQHQKQEEDQDIDKDENEDMDAILGRGSVTPPVLLKRIGGSDRKLPIGLSVPLPVLSHTFAGGRDTGAGARLLAYTSNESSLGSGGLGRAGVHAAGAGTDTVAESFSRLD